MSTTPSPASTYWVPLSGPSVDLRYTGGWASGVTYNDGDIVIGSDGLPYICVTNGTTTAPNPWPGISPFAVSYATTLPANPVNGQEAILVDSATNPTYQWRFRYNANSTSAYKWEFVGGAPAYLTAAQDTLTQANIWTYPSILLDFAAPRSGDYIGTCNTSFQVNAANPGYFLGIGNASVGTSPVGVYNGMYQAITNVTCGVFTQTKLSAITAGQTLRQIYYTTVVNATVSNRMMTIQPVRVS